jgi:hypothetical protein
MSILLQTDTLSVAQENFSRNGSVENIIHYRITN